MLVLTVPMDSGSEMTNFVLTSKRLILFFPLLIMLHWDVYNHIPVDVLFSPLSNLKYSRWRLRWLSGMTKIINFSLMSYEC